jgi:predicted NBD/HSP70 family sugar kinase
VPVRIGNDANLGALAEATFGAARELENFVYVMLSAGVGAGIILDGRLYEGGTGTAGEIGHVVVDPGGQQWAWRQPWRVMRRSLPPRLMADGAGL